MKDTFDLISGQPEDRWGAERASWDRERERIKRLQRMLREAEFDKPDDVLGQ